MNRTILAVAASLTVAVGAAATNSPAQSGDTTAGPAGVPTSTAPFDQQFIDVMASHHQAAIVMSRTGLRRGRSAKVKKIARSIIRAQSAEITKFHKLRKRWYGSAA